MNAFLKTAGRFGSIVALIMLVVTLLRQLIALINYLIATIGLIMTIIKVGVIVAFAGVFVLVVMMILRESRKRRRSLDDRLD